MAAVSVEGDCIVKPGFDCLNYRSFRPSESALILSILSSIQITTLGADLTTVANIHLGPWCEGIISAQMITFHSRSDMILAK